MPETTPATPSDLDLIEPMKSAAHAVAEFVAAVPVARPAAATWTEFREHFDALDKPAMKLLRERLSPLRPRAVWAEELGGGIPDTGEAWVVDTVDGAVQFLQDLPQWSVSVTFVRDGRPVATVLHSHVLGETYTAVAGSGARRDGLPVEPSAKTDLSLCLLGTSQPPAIASQPRAVAEAGRSLSAVLPFAGAVRNLGPTSWQIADTAAGRLDAFWEFGADDGNLLGAALVATEAGLLVTDTEGRPWRAGAGSFLAAPARLHGTLVAMFREAAVG
ncbi:inositol monophosphatase family protein [Streptomyces sp. 150FB]|uniref:inositol monophosphatase family protein n=1 Tax=Streptomyces sp. 150FB TaxID=1576605 RepID=UPI0006989D0F|nr:inositol monophosphatase family protein [Streptomyces sp. 150FB]